MSNLKEQMLRLIQQKANRKVAVLSTRYVHANPGEKEVIHAAMEIERWLAASCRQCL
jgi:hypothetical protein